MDCRFSSKLAVELTHIRLTEDTPKGRRRARRYFALRPNVAAVGDLTSRDPVAEAYSSFGIRSHSLRRCVPPVPDGPGYFYPWSPFASKRVAGSGRMASWARGEVGGSLDTAN